MTIGELIGLFLKAFIIANLIMLVFAMMTWIERRLLSFFQYRLGPNRVGPFGILQPIADLAKLIRKENFRPNSVSAVLHLVAPVITLFFALAVFCVIPFGDQDWNIAGWHTAPGMAPDLGVGVIFAIALSGLGGYGVIVGGWASNSKYALLGALRACAQLISYEVAMTLAILPIIMMTQSLSMAQIATGHTAWSMGGWHPWFIVWAPLGFVIFAISALAEANRAPFDHAEAEQELVGGFHTEYGGLRYAAFANAEYLHMLAISAIGVVFFLGGTSIPWMPDAGAWLDVLSFLVKMAFFLFVFIWIRATVPRLRYDRLMRFGWKAMLPLATAQVLVTALIVSQGWGHA
ncbi:MAG: NADH-quinone oxidoreductase subunit H [Thermoleophilia bacterium]|nr:NADH-quinone oxidoreductase subunit H [Thermoleophilia bacterium]